MNVDYVSHMGDDLMVANAARVSFSKHKDELDDKDEKLIKYLADHNHWTPFSHPSIALRVRAPIFVARQLFKHKVGMTENEVSRRYVDDAPEFYQPKEWRARPENGMKQGSGEQVVQVEELWIHDYFANAKETYHTLIEAGVAPEQARMVLPQAMYTEWYWTGSLAALARVAKLRLDPHAQAETREVAQMISDILKPLFPISWSVLVE